MENRRQFKRICGPTAAALALLFLAAACTIPAGTLRPCACVHDFSLCLSRGQRPFEAQGEWTCPDAPTNDGRLRLYLARARLTHDFESWIKKPYANFWLYVVPYREDLAEEAARFGESSDGRVLGRYLRGAYLKAFTRKGLIDRFDHDPDVVRVHLPGPFRSNNGFCEWTDTDDVAPQTLDYTGLALWDWDREPAVKRVLVLLTEGDDAWFDDFVGVYVVSKDETLERPLALGDEPDQPYGEGNAATLSFETRRSPSPAASPAPPAAAGACGQGCPEAGEGPEK